MTDITTEACPRTVAPVRGAVVLVAYATRFGSTKGIAERIADRLGDAGHRPDLRPLDAVPPVDRYDAVVLGSAVFDQRWLPQADAFVARHADALRGRPVWLFSVGTFGDRKRVLGRLVKREPRNIRAVTAALAPRDYRVFAGVIDRRQWPLLSRLFFHALGGRLGDNRPWPDIDSWASAIARELAAVGAAAPART